MKTAKNIALPIVLVSLCSAFGAIAQTASPTTPRQAPARKTVQLQVPSLGTITVTGSQLHVLWEIKRALNRRHSFHDPHQLVCKVAGMTGSHVNKKLICETNRQWWKRVEAVQLRWLTGHAVGTKVYFTSGINFSRFRQLMRSLPPEDGE